ncbi:GGDEF domain-containing protein, partial [Vibrio cholerae]|nr:GGDEF domain-containing protein [Vibrio cholerae]
MTTEDFKKSTANLKKVVPLMINHHVAATPLKYTSSKTHINNNN